MNLGRIFRHLSITRWSTERRFTPAILRGIEDAIGELEKQHAGELRFVVEAALDLPELLRDETPRQRAIELFGQLGVWDTADNNGVLIYVLLADHDVEILADRGIAARVPPADWERICHEMEEHYRADRFEEGSLAGVRAVGRLLARHFPGGRGDANELPNQPVLI